MDLTSKRILVTGGSGFLGSHLVDRLRGEGVPEEAIVVPRSREYDLTDQAAVRRLYDEVHPDVVIHLAATVGGIGANRLHPGRFFYDNLVMGVEVIEQARLHDTEKVVVVGTICSYPKFTPVPFREEDLWAGYPEETNAPYGIAKKALLVQAQAYREEYGLDSIYLLPVNLYGPRDDFDPVTSHVIPALIRKCHEAIVEGAHEIVCWGDGSPTREFLYVEDAAEGILRATREYEDPDPVNLGSGREISILDLVHLIAEKVGFEGDIRWDTSKPNGQPRRCLDVSRAKERFGFESRTSLEEGLEATIESYLAEVERDDDRPALVHGDGSAARDPT